VVVVLFLVVASPVLSLVVLVVAHQTKETLVLELLVRDTLAVRVERAVVAAAVVLPLLVRLRTLLVVATHTLLAVAAEQVVLQQ
jgi:hypothetical protein